jgi:hypothetical protein
MRDIDELIRLVREGDEHSAAAFAEDLCDEIERLRGIMATCEWCGPDVGADQPSAVQGWKRIGGTAPDCVTISLDGLLNVPAGVPAGEYTIEYVDPRYDPITPDQQSARKGLDELTRMEQEDGLYDVEQCAPPAKVGDVVTFADGRKFVVTSTPDKT